MCHILAYNAIPSTGNGLIKFAVFITQHQCKAVHFPADDHRTVPGKSDQIFNGFGLICRQHGLCMRNGC